MAAVPLTALELLMDFLTRCGCAAGAVALEEQAELCFALCQVQRCNRRVALQLRGMRCARAAQAARRAMWRERALLLEHQLGTLLDTVTDINTEQPLLRRVRRLVSLRRQDQELLARIWVRRPSLLNWAVRAQNEVRAAEQSSESESEAEE